MVHPRCTLLWGTGFLPARRGGERPGLREHEMLVAAGTEPGALHPSCSGLLLRTPAQDSPCLLPSARAMKYVSRTERRQIVLYLETWLNNNEPRWKVPAMAFLVEVSPMASGAGLSCLSPLHPLVATAVGRGRPVELGQGFIPWGSSPWHTLPE